MPENALARLCRRWMIFALFLVICIPGLWWLWPGAAMAGPQAIKLPRFAGLAGFLEHNSDAHFMVYKPGFGWMAWGARTRSEYTYAVSFAEAAKVAGFAFTARR